MDNTTQTALLGLLKLDLGITHSLRDAYFSSVLDTAEGELSRMGVSLELTKADDQLLLIDYAAWGYRHRSENISLARSIQFRIHNRVIQKAAKPATTLYQLLIGLLTLSPAFDRNVKEYTATTVNAEDAISIVTDDAFAVYHILVNGVEINNGDAAIWTAGDNTITITVTNGYEETAYTVIVTKES